MALEFLLILVLFIIAEKILEWNLARPDSILGWYAKIFGRTFDHGNAKFKEGTHHRTGLCFLLNVEFWITLDIFIYPSDYDVDHPTCCVPFHHNSSSACRLIPRYIFCTIIITLQKLTQTFWISLQIRFLIIVSRFNLTITIEVTISRAFYH